MIKWWPAGTCLGNPHLPGPPAPGALGSRTPSPPAPWGIQEHPEPGIQGSTWPFCTHAFSLSPLLPTPAYQPERVIEIPAQAPHFPPPGLSLCDFLYLCFCSPLPLPAMLKCLMSPGPPARQTQAECAPSDTPEPSLSTNSSSPQRQAVLPLRAALSSPSLSPGQEQLTEARGQALRCGAGPEAVHGYGKTKERGGERPGPSR